MLDLFRKRGLSSVIYGVIIAATITVFVIQFRPNAGQKTSSIRQACVATVRGWCIDPKDHRSTYQLLMPKDREGNRDAPQAKRMGLSRIALNGLIERELLVEEAERIGLKVTDDEITNQIYDGWIRVSVPSDDPSLRYQLLGPPREDRPEGALYAGFRDQKTKQFDVKVYERQLRGLVGRSPTEFREEQGREILAAKMRDLVTAPVRVSETEALELYVSAKSSATVAYVPVKAAWVEKWAVSPALTGAAVEAWMKDKPSADLVESTAAQREADDAPKAGHVRHILFHTPKDPTETDLRAAAVKLAQARAKIAAGATFAEVARLQSEDRGSAAKGGDLGDKMDGMVAPFRDAANALKAGEITGSAIQSQFGLHLIAKDDPAKEADVKAAIRKDVARELFVKAQGMVRAKEIAAKILADVTAGKKPEDAIAAVTASLPKPAGEPAPMPIKREAKPIVDAGADATTPSAEPKKPADPAKPLTAETDPDRPEVVQSQSFNQGGDPIPGLSPETQRKIVTFAFAGKDGDWNGEAVQSESGFVVVQLKEHKISTKEDFEKEKTTVLQSLMLAKRAEALALHVKRLREDAKDAIKIDETFLIDGKPATDGGGAPPMDEEEEGP